MHGAGDMDDAVVGEHALVPLLVASDLEAIAGVAVAARLGVRQVS